VGVNRDWNEVKNYLTPEMSEIFVTFAERIEVASYQMPLKIASVVAVRTWSCTSGVLGKSFAQRLESVCTAPVKRAFAKCTDAACLSCEDD
jgi:hypothetical protein